MTANARIDASRLWTSLMEMARIGATERGGCRRLALTDEDRAGRDLFVRWCREAGCEVTVDRIGNVFARRPGRDPARPAVATGSHLDTQPHGGKFDGVYGVLAGLEVVRTLNDLGIETETPVEIVVWTNEEGARFAPSMIASGVFAGAYDLDYALARRDVDGHTLGEELERIGYAGDAACGDREYAAFFEAHIEQGPILEREGDTIGVVTGVQGTRWYDVHLTGRDSHSGSTPMPGRRNALLGAARVVEAVDAIALAHAPDAVGTVGHLDVSPNSRNTIPGHVYLTVDLRHPDAAVLERLDAELRARVDAIARATDLAAELEEIQYTRPVVFDDECVAAVRTAASTLGLRWREMWSGAGHDSCYVAQVAPTSMIFVPCAEGLSHNEEESATPADLAAGADVLLSAVLARAGVAP